MQYEYLNDRDSVADLCFGDIEPKDAAIIVELWRKWIQQKIRNFSLSKTTFFKSE